MLCFVKEAGGGWAARGARGKFRIWKQASKAEFDRPDPAHWPTGEGAVKNANRAKLKGVGASSKSAKLGAARRRGKSVAARKPMSEHEALLREQLVSLLK